MNNRDLKSLVKQVFPKSLVRTLQDFRLRSMAKSSTQEVFTKIYSERLWGTGTGEFYSGEGSDEAISNTYSRKVAEFISEKKIKSMIDIGCGDFRVSSNILSKVNHEMKYTGIDVVEPLILYNEKTYGNDYTNFLCLDAVKDQPPSAELCTIREVLQHLSNYQISIILNKLQAYKYVLITERQALKKANTIVNIDKVQGPHTRVMDNSGIYLEEKPFNLQVKVLFEYEALAKDRYEKTIPTVLKTYLIENR